MADSAPLRVCLVVESGTDVRLVDGLAARCDLTVLARRIVGGVEISRPPASSNVTLEVGAASMRTFAQQVFRTVRARHREFDCVLVQGYGAAAAAANLAMRTRRVAGAMLVCSPVEEYYRCRAAAAWPRKPFRRWELAALRLLAALNARVGSGYVVLSEHLAATVRRHGARGFVEIIPVYGVDTSVFRPHLGDRSALRQARELPANGRVIFFSSRVAPEKDSETLLRAFVALRVQGRDVYLLHRSGGYREFTHLAAAHGVGDRLMATDAVHPSNLPGDYQAADLCVQASRAEGLGYSVLESLASGTPVVATRTGGLAETIVDGVTGWTYPPGDHQALAAAMADALDRPAEAKRRAEAGRQMVMERFEAAMVFDRLICLMRALANRTREEAS